MEEFVHVNEEDLQVELTRAEEDLEKLLSIERNEVDLINENLKLKKTLRNAKVGMWRKFQDIVKQKAESEKQGQDSQKKIGERVEPITKRGTGRGQQETVGRHRRIGTGEETIRRKHEGSDG